MPKTNVKLDIKTEAARLKRRLSDYADCAGKDLKTCILDAAKLFTQSSSKDTPPLKGKVAHDCKDLFHREVRLYDSGEKVSFRKAERRAPIFFRYGDYPNRLTAHYIALEHAIISYRYLGKAGWWKSLQELGGDASQFIRLNPFLLSHVPPSTHALKQEELLRDGGVEKFSVEISNRVKGIGTYGVYAVAQALRATNNRLKWAISGLKKRAGKEATP